MQVPKMVIDLVICVLFCMLRICCRTVLWLSTLFTFCAVFVLLLACCITTMLAMDVPEVTLSFFPSVVVAMVVLCNGAFPSFFILLWLEGDGVLEIVGDVVKGVVTLANESSIRGQQSKYKLPLYFSCCSGVSKSFTFVSEIADTNPMGRGLWSRPDMMRLGIEYRLLARFRAAGEGCREEINLEIFLGMLDGRVFITSQWWCGGLTSKCYDDVRMASDDRPQRSGTSNISHGSKAAITVEGSKWCCFIAEMMR